MGLARTAGWCRAPAPEANSNRPACLAEMEMPVCGSLLAPSRPGDEPGPDGKGADGPQLQHWLNMLRAADKGGTWIDASDKRHRPCSSLHRCSRGPEAFGGRHGQH